MAGPSVFGPHGGQGYGPSSGYASPQAKNPVSRSSVPVSGGGYGEQDVFGLLKRTLAQKDAEIARLKQEGEANVRRLEQQLQEVRAALAAKTAYVKRLEGAPAPRPMRAAAAPKEVFAAPERRPVPTEAMNLSVGGIEPPIPYHSVAPTDPIDVQLESTYNQTACTIPFKRINKGFYHFGSTKVEMEMVNHKLMARTEDGWNRGKFGPIERFMQYFEPMEVKKQQDIARRKSGGRF
jgi:hypothetical protein